MTDNEIVAFDQGYKLGFRAGQLDQYKYSLACHQRKDAVIAGHSIALARGNISLEEYERAISHEEGTC